MNKIETIAALRDIASAKYHSRASDKLECRTYGDTLRHVPASTKYEEFNELVIYVADALEKSCLTTETQFEMESSQGYIKLHLVAGIRKIELVWLWTQYLGCPEFMSKLRRCESLLRKPQPSPCGI